MIRAGLVSIDTGDRWIGGRYYLHHLAKCVAHAGDAAEVELRDVTWGAQADPDPFAEVRNLLDEPIIVKPPTSPGARLLRKIRRSILGIKDARDLFEKEGLDLFFPIPPCDNAGLPYVFWLPDFQYLRRPDLLSKEMRDWMEAYFRTHVAAAAQIILSSEDARSDFAIVFPERIGSTHVVRFCSVPDEQWWALEPTDVARKYRLPDRFLIVCNQFTRHKNHLLLMEALKLLREGGLGDVHIVCTGSAFDHRGEDYVGLVRRYVEEQSLQEQVHILGLIPRAEQIALVRRAAAVVQPSLFEGWSTIIEDAKTLGKPVFASDLPVHAEQLGSRAALLPQDDPQEWATAIAAEWAQMRPGPSSEREAEGLQRLELAKQDCARAFVQALKSAVKTERRP